MEGLRRNICWMICVCLVLILVPPTSSAQEISSYAVDPYEPYQSYQEITYQPIFHPRPRARPRSFWASAQDVTSRTFKSVTGLIDFLWIPTLAILAYDAFVPRYRHFRSERSIDVYDQDTSDWNNVFDLFTTVTRSEECLQRVVCELGSSTSNIVSKPYQKLFFTFFGDFIPNNYQKLFTKFRLGATKDEECYKIYCPSIEKKNKKI